MAITDLAGSRFTSLLWSDIEGTAAEVMRHPFITGLIDGTLPRECFRHYIIQDSHYLYTYARVLALCAAKAGSDADAVMFARHAGETVAMEKELHASLLAEMGTGQEAAAAEPVAPTTRAYLDFLLASAYTGSYGEAVGAVLPCYWVYAEVGRTLRAAGSPDPLYARWIAAYGDADFQATTGQVLAVADRVGAAAPEAERTLIRERVRTAARYEWMFWDAGFRRESWPV
ncbi:TenA family protein [Streptomyces sp. CAU 1734]|uniref:TenA family protein n=1 Tax=Streptomyces sp. CAU 1734 TaxID=3140360 RepID=UPI003260F55D